MKFILNNEKFSLKLELYDYTENELDYDWCMGSIDFSCGDFKFNVEDKELFICDDINGVKSIIEEVILYGADESMELMCSQFDLKVTVNPDKTSVLSSNEISIELNEEETDALYTYLQFVCEEYDECAERIDAYVEKGYLEV